MAIKFVDKTPGGAGELKKTTDFSKPRKPTADAEIDAGDGCHEARLPFAKSRPKQRGRKKSSK